VGRLAGIRASRFLRPPQDARPGTRRSFLIVIAGRAVLGAMGAGSRLSESFRPGRGADSSGQGQTEGAISGPALERGPPEPPAGTRAGRINRQKACTSNGARKAGSTGGPGAGAAGCFAAPDTDPYSRAFWVRSPN